MKIRVTSPGSHRHGLYLKRETRRRRRAHQARENRLRNAMFSYFDVPSGISLTHSRRSKPVERSGDKARLSRRMDALIAPLRAELDALGELHATAMFLLPLPPVQMEHGTLTGIDEVPTEFTHDDFLKVKNRLGEIVDMRLSGVDMGARPDETVMTEIGPDGKVSAIERAQEHKVECVKCTHLEFFGEARRCKLGFETTSKYSLELHCTVTVPAGPCMFKSHLQARNELERDKKRVGHTSFIIEAGGKLSTYEGSANVQPVKRTNLLPDVDVEDC